MIYRTLLKNGYSKFSLEILDLGRRLKAAEGILKGSYCAASKCIPPFFFRLKKKGAEREQYYLDLLMPEYNILKVAGSSQGRKHSDEAKAKMRVITSKRLVSWPLTRQGSGSETALWARTIKTSS